MNIQFKKGVLELCVLSLLTKRNRYGYELVSEISKKIEISEGTIYPLLRKLKDDGQVTTYLEESKSGPSRKYYQLTKKGEKMSKNLKEEWKEFAKQVSTILEK